MKILLYGQNGQLGWELQRSLSTLGAVHCLDRQLDAGDFTQHLAVRDYVREFKPELIVNAAAYTAVDRAEAEPEIARSINAIAPGLLAREARELGAWLVHFSTDYVFDGSGSKAWSEDSPIGPLSVYGRTKLEGDDAVSASGCKHLIFRTSWVYAARGQNFIKSILRAAQEKDSLQVVNDQIGAPTGAELLADASVVALRAALRAPELGGLYHLSASGAASWHEYACFVLQEARELGVELRAGPEAVAAISSEQLASAAPRPKNSRLDTSRVCAAFGLRLPPWQDGVRRVLAEILA